MNKKPNLETYQGKHDQNPSSAQQKGHHSEPDPDSDPDPSPARTLLQKDHHSTQQVRDQTQDRVNIWIQDWIRNQNQLQIQNQRQPLFTTRNSGQIRTSMKQKPTPEQALRWRRIMDRKITLRRIRGCRYRTCFRTRPTASPEHRSRQPPIQVNSLLLTTQ